MHLTGGFDKRKYLSLSGARSRRLMIYDDDVFRMACAQFQVIADYLDIDKNERERLMYPKRSMAVTLPVHMDDGSTRTFQGYRVQHHFVRHNQTECVNGIVPRLLTSVNAGRLHVIYRQARPLPLLLDTSVLQQWAAWL